MKIAKSQKYRPLWTIPIILILLPMAGGCEGVIELVMESIESKNAAKLLTNRSKLAAEIVAKESLAPTGETLSEKFLAGEETETLIASKSAGIAYQSAKLAADNRFFKAAEALRIFREEQLATNMAHVSKLRTTLYRIKVIIKVKDDVLWLSTMVDGSRFDFNTYVNLLNVAGIDSLIHQNATFDPVHQP